jgi:hypothetical protein
LSISPPTYLVIHSTIPQYNVLGLILENMK